MEKTSYYKIPEHIKIVFFWFYIDKRSEVVEKCTILIGYDFPDKNEYQIQSQRLKIYVNTKFPCMMMLRREETWS